MTTYLFPVTRLNEGDECLVNLRGIDSIEPITPLGTIIHLSSGWAVRARESVKEITQMLLEAEPE